MSARVDPYTLVVAVGGLLFVGCDQPVRTPEEPPAEHRRGAPKQPADPPADKPKRLISFEPGILPLDGGHVVTVNNEGITIRTRARKEIVTYPFHDALAGGGLQEHACDVFGYRRQDPRVGDEVWLSICTEDGKKFCAEISIRKRPAGRVPESSAKSKGDLTYAMMRNAENDLADFGIPIPDNCKSKMPLAMQMGPELEQFMKELNAKLEAQAKGQKPPAPKKQP